MKAVFVETSSFTRMVEQYFAGDGDYQEFQMALLEQPEKGDVIQGCGGLRKVRWKNTRRRKGARSGLRIIYLYVPEISRFLLLDVFTKDEADDLTQDERKFLAGLAEDYRTEAIAAAGRRERKVMRKSIFERLKEGLEEGVLHEQGGSDLKSFSITIPKPPREYDPDDIRKIRDRLEMSQAQFAKFLFVSTKTVQGWEQGLRRPTSSAARLLQFIEDPELLSRSVG